MNRLAALILLLPLAGCGNLTAGGISDVDVTVSGDAPDPPAAPAPVAGAEAWPQGGGHDGESEADGEAEGELDAIFTISLESEGGELVPLSDDDVRVDVDIQGVREFQLAQRSIPAQRYVALHVFFDEIEVEVDAGLVINGVEITGPVAVDLEAQDVEVVRPLDLRLDDGDRITVLLDLNAQDWLFQVDPELSTVPQQFFVDAISVRIN